MDSTAPQWAWPADLDSQTDYSESAQPAYRRPRYARPEPSNGSPEQSEPADFQEEEAPEPTPTRPRRYYKPRTCRICLEEVLPTTEIDDSLAGRMFSEPRVRYVSDDPELGRLMSPCLCKGSQKYVHEGCLQAWREAMPLDDQHHYRCPTCNFQYRLERLRWSHWLSSRTLRAGLTVLVMLVTVFVLGFFADPFIRWLRDSPSLMFAEFDLDTEMTSKAFPGFEDISPGGWTFHFFKGFLSLGVLGFVKAIWSLPYYWYRIGGGRRGRRRENAIDWNTYLVIVIGVVTFMFAAWKFVSKITSRFLEKASDRVMDVQEDNGPDEDDEDDE